jgi:flagellar protein FliO/FliZ
MTTMRGVYSVAVAANLYTTAAFATSDTTASDSGSVGSLIVALILVAGAAAAATWVLRHWKGSVGKREGPLQLVHVIALGPRERLALVKVGGRYLVVGITPTQISRVAEMSDIQDVSTVLDPDSTPPPTDTG